MFYSKVSTFTRWYSYGYLLVIIGYKWDEKHSTNGVIVQYLSLIFRAITVVMSDGLLISELLDLSHSPRVCFLYVYHKVVPPCYELVYNQRIDISPINHIVISLMFTN